MMFDLGHDGTFYGWLEEADMSGVHETRRIVVPGLWRRVPEGEDDPVETEATLYITLEEFPPPHVTDPEALISLTWAEYQVEED